MTSCTRLLVSLFVACAGSLSAQNSFSFSLGAGGEHFENKLIFASGGITATATAWSVDRANLSAGFQASQVSQWSPGIGVRNSSEVITDTPYVPFYVDNEDHYDFLLFVFSQPVDVSSVTITPSAGTFDLDASYFFGNINSAVDLTGKTLSSLGSSGFGSRINDDNAVATHSPRRLALSGPAGGVNALLFGARVNGDAEFDRFKVSTINGVSAVPEPSAAALLLGAFVLLATTRRRR